MTTLTDRVGRHRPSFGTDSEDQSLRLTRGVPAAGGWTCSAMGAELRVRGEPGPATLDAVAEVVRVGVPGVAVAVSGVDEPERVGAVDQPAVGEHPVEQG